LLPGFVAQLGLPNPAPVSLPDRPGSQTESGDKCPNELTEFEHLEQHEESIVPRIVVLTIMHVKRGRYLIQDPTGQTLAYQFNKRDARKMKKAAEHILAATDECGTVIEDING